jgi:nitronate monooxygenase
MPTRSHPLPSRIPLIQAPMAGCQDERLALAVSAAGALGSLPAALLAPAALDAALQRLDQSGLPYNVNFFAHRMPTPDADRLRGWTERLRPWYAEAGLGEPPAPQPGRRAFDDEAAEILLAHRPAVVSFHFGLPERRLLDRVRASGAMILSSATSLAEAQALQAEGVDAVIAQGIEAGGHRGHFLSTELSAQLPTERLLTLLVGSLRVPIIAAGGIADAAQAERALALGASAVQAGTAFLLCREATTSPLHRRRLQDPAGETLLTNAFTGGVARGLPNRLTRQIPGVHPDVPPFPWASASLAPLRAWAEAQDRDDYTPLWCGTQRSQLRTGPAAEVVRQLMPAQAMALAAEVQRHAD